MEYILTKLGKQKAADYISECVAKRKEILDAGIDTANETDLPTEADIVSDLNNGVGIDEEGDYFNNWGVTDNYITDYPICLSINEDFVEVE